MPTVSGRLSVGKSLLEDVLLRTFVERRYSAASAPLGALTSMSKRPLALGLTLATVLGALQLSCCWTSMLGTGLPRGGITCPVSVTLAPPLVGGSRIRRLVSLRFSDCRPSDSAM